MFILSFTNSRMNGHVPSAVGLLRNPATAKDAFVQTAIEDVTLTRALHLYS